jgi:hypothetical protein
MPSFLDSPAGTMSLCGEAEEIKVTKEEGSHRPVANFSLELAIELAGYFAGIHAII